MALAGDDGDAPIGVFDSGVGGLTVSRAILDQLPDEPILYLGDTAHAPYGPRRLSEVRSLALEALDVLVERGAKLLVIACNAASAACLRDARERYPVPVVEVVTPAVRRAARATRNGRVGVIGTGVTIASRAYDDAFAGNPDITLTTVACPRFVEFVERGETHGADLLAVAAEYLEPILVAGCDTLVLGCTHYPLLTGVLSAVLGDAVTLVPSAEETAKDVYRTLTLHGSARASGSPPGHRFLSTGDPRLFFELGARFLGPEMGPVERVGSLVPGPR